MNSLSKYSLLILFISKSDISEDKMVSFLFIIIKSLFSFTSASSKRSLSKKDLSKEDNKTWQDYIENPSDVYDKDKSKSFKDKVKGRFKFDLHGYTLLEANQKVSRKLLNHQKRWKK